MVDGLAKKRNSEIFSKIRFELYTFFVRYFTVNLNIFKYSFFGFVLHNFFWLISDAKHSFLVGRKCRCKFYFLYLKLIKHILAMLNGTARSKKSFTVQSRVARRQQISMVGTASVLVTTNLSFTESHKFFDNYFEHFEVVVSYQETWEDSKHEKKPIHH